MFIFELPLCCEFVHFIHRRVLSLYCCSKFRQAYNTKIQKCGLSHKICIELTINDKNTAVIRFNDKYWVAWVAQELCWVVRRGAFVVYICSAILAALPGAKLWVFFMHAKYRAFSSSTIVPSCQFSVTQQECNAIFICPYIYEFTMTTSYSLE